MVSNQASIEALIDSLERVKDGIVVFDNNFNYLFINDEGGKLLGRAPVELIGKNYFEEYPEAKDTPFANAYLEAYNEQKTIILENYYKPWNRWFSNRIFSSPGGITILFQEITQIKKNEQELINSGNMVKGVLEELPEGILLLDCETKRFVFANNMACNMVGYSREELYGFTPDDLHPDEELNRGRGIMEITPGEIRVVSDIGILRSDRSVFPADISAVKLMFDGRDCICGVITDISERKSAQRKIMAQISELRRWHEATIGREGRVLELKREVNELLKELGKPPRYESVK